MIAGVLMSAFAGICWCVTVCLPVCVLAHVLEYVSLRLLACVCVSMMFVYACICVHLLLWALICVLLLSLPPPDKRQCGHPEEQCRGFSLRYAGNFGGHRNRAADRSASSKGAGNRQNRRHRRLRRRRSFRHLCRRFRVYALKVASLHRIS